jgi:hypothetical protein
MGEGANVDGHPSVLISNQPDRRFHLVLYDSVVTLVLSMLSRRLAGSQ